MGMKAVAGSLFFLSAGISLGNYPMVSIMYLVVGMLLMILDSLEDFINAPIH